VRASRHSDLQRSILGIWGCQAGEDVYDVAAWLLFMLIPTKRSRRARVAHGLAYVCARPPRLPIHARRAGLARVTPMKSNARTGRVLAAKTRGLSIAKARATMCLSDSV
jgi:hypothetical protein